MNKHNQRVILFALGLLGLVMAFSSRTYVSRERISKIPPLTTVQGAQIKLDFNTPTPTQIPSPTPTPTLSPTPLPTLTPTPTTAPINPAQLDAWFTQYANHYSVDRSLLRQIAACETGFRSNAVNWIYGGMYQFSPNTWSSNRRTMGLDPNPELRFNPEEAIKTAAFVLSTRGESAWPNCSKR